MIHTSEANLRITENMPMAMDTKISAIMIRKTTCKRNAANNRILGITTEAEGYNNSDSASKYQVEAVGNYNHPAVLLGLFSPNRDKNQRCSILIMSALSCARAIFRVIPSQCFVYFSLITTSHVCCPSVITSSSSLSSYYLVRRRKDRV